jgi:hypothetical protein
MGPISSYLLEMLWVRIHGGSGQVHDTRKSDRAPSDRGGAPEVQKHSNISQRGQASLPRNLEEGTQVLRVDSTGKTILPHDTIHRVVPHRNSRPRSTICLSTHLVVTTHNLFFAEQYLSGIDDGDIYIS